MQNLLGLLVAPITAYPTPLLLLQLPTYTPILQMQPYATRRSIGHAIVSSLLKKETIITTPEEVKGILDLCHTLVRDQKDAGHGMPTHLGSNGVSNGSNWGRGQQPPPGALASSRGMIRNHSQRGAQPYDYEEMAEEQGWVARLVHLFRNDDDDIQFKVSWIIFLHMAC